MSLDEVKSRVWPREYAGRFGPQSSIFIEEEYGSDALTCFEYVGDLRVAGAELRRELLDRSGGTAFFLIVDGNLEVDGFVDLQGNHCLAVTKDLRCEDLFADSYSYVSVAGDLRVERALVSCMMTDCGIAVDGGVAAQFIGTAAHAVHHIKPTTGAIMLDSVTDHARLRHRSHRRRGREQLHSQELRRAPAQRQAPLQGHARRAPRARAMMPRGCGVISDDVGVGPGGSLRRSALQRPRWTARSPR